MATDEPKSVLCAGLYSSGSTWICNAVLEIWAEKHGKDAACLVFADSTNQFEGESAQVSNDLLVIKSHSPTSGLRLMARLASLPVILSVREPRDAVASLVSRFGLTFDAALIAVCQSAEQLSDLAILPGQANTLFLRYEDNFTSDPVSVQTIAASLKVAITSAQADRIATDLAPAAVKAKIAKLAEQGVFEDRPPAATWDPKTHWHPSHVGDGKVGKWRTILTPAQGAKVAYSTRHFRAIFGYDDELETWSPGDVIDFSSAGTGSYFLEQGFSDPEDWGVWSESSAARILIPLSGPLTTSVTLQFEAILGPGLVSASDAMVQVQVNQWHTLTIRADAVMSGRSTLAVSVDAAALKGAREIVIDILADKLLSGTELGINDTRRLGLGLCSLRILNANHTISALAHHSNALVHDRNAQEIATAKAAGEKRRLSHQSDATEAHHEAIQAECDTLRNALHLMTAAFGEANNNLSVVAAEREVFSQWCAAIEADRDAVESARDGLRAELDSLAASAGEANNRIHHLTHERDVLSVEVESLRVERDRSQDGLDALSIAFEDVSSKVRELSKERDLISQEIEVIRADHWTIQLDRNGLMNALEVQKLALEETTAGALQLVEARDRLIQDAKVIRADHENLRSDRDGLLTELNDLKAAFEYNATWTRQLSESRDLLIQDADLLRIDLDGLQTAFDALKAELQEAIASAGQAIEERDRLAQDLGVLSADGEALLSDRGSLRNDVAALKVALQDADEIARQRAGELDVLTRNNEAILAARDAAEAALDALGTDYGAQTEKLGEAWSVIDRLQGEANAANAKIAATVERLTQSQASVALYDASLADVSTSLAELAAFDALDHTAMSSQQWEQKIAAFEQAIPRLEDNAQPPEMTTMKAALASICSTRAAEARRKGHAGPLRLLRGRQR